MLLLHLIFNFVLAFSVLNFSKAKCVKNAIYCTLYDDFGQHSLVNRHLYRGMNISSDNHLIKWLNNSVKLMNSRNNRNTLFNSTRQYKLHKRTQHLHYRYINERKNILAQKLIHQRSFFYNYNLNHLWFTKNVLHNNIFYHVECPSPDVVLRIIINGEILNVTATQSKCEYFRWIVRKALDIFNRNSTMFNYIELPSEIMDDSMFIQYDNIRIPIEMILNFAFVNNTHTLFYYNKKQIKCRKFPENKKESGVAHLIGSSVHLSVDKNYCITDIPYSMYDLNEKYNCTNDLLFVLLHELSHYFIAECHIDIDFLKKFSTSRSMDQKTFDLMLDTWHTSDGKIHCNSTRYSKNQPTTSGPIAFSTTSPLPPSLPQFQTSSKNQPTTSGPIAFSTTSPLPSSLPQFQTTTPESFMITTPTTLSNVSSQPMKTLFPTNQTSPPTKQSPISTNASATTASPIKIVAPSTKLVLGATTTTKPLTTSKFIGTTQHYDDDNFLFQTEIEEDNLKNIIDVDGDNQDLYVDSGSGAGPD